MNKKLIFRILGALASALIIVSVFVPFVSVTGYSYSLWGSNEVTNSLYLPIMIIVFGVIGVIFFSLNIKTEFAYMSTGAITFFLVVQTVDILSQGVFNTLSMGYYFLVVGAILTGLMAFLLNLRSNKNNVQSVTTVQESSNMLGQIDSLYNNDQNLQNNISPIQPIEPVIQPIPAQPLENVQPIEAVQSMESVVPVTSIEPIQNVPPIPVQPVETIDPIQTNENVVPIAPIEPVPTVDLAQPKEQIQPIELNQSNETVDTLEPIKSLESQKVNPVLEQFNQPNINPTAQEFSMSTEPIQYQFQPQPVLDTSNISVLNDNEASSVNPVVQDFINPGLQNQPQTDSNLQQVTPQVNQSTGDVDIFGQPINK